MKITAITKSEKDADIITMSGSVIGIDYYDKKLSFDLSNIESLETQEDRDNGRPEYIELLPDKSNQAEVDARIAEIEAYDREHRFYVDQNGDVHGIIYVRKAHGFAWINNNMRDLFGFSDGIVTLEELQKYMIYHAEIQAILDGDQDELKIRAINKRHLSAE